MTACAHTGAMKGRLRPSFFFWLCLANGVLAQQPVFRCGQAYTNVPQDPERCERLVPQAITVIPGGRAQNLPGPAPGQALPAAATVPQTPRDGMARQILLAELEQARLRHEQLLAQYRRPDGLSEASEAQQAAAPGQDRVRRLQAALERSQRDIDSLQRELARRSGAAHP